MNSFRFALRQLKRNPVTGLVVILTLSLGISASATLFGVANAVLLQPLPFPDSERLVWLWSVDSQEQLKQRASYPDFADWQSQSETLDLVGYGGLQSVMTGNGDPVRWRTELYLGDLFGLLGVQPLLGSTQANASQEPAAILSYDLWSRRFAADPAVVGTSVTLGGTSYRIAAVMPPDFQFPIRTGEVVDAWTPIAQFNPVLANARGARLIEVIGRIRPGATLEQAQAEMNLIASNLSAQYPETNAGIGVRVTSALDEVTGDYSRGILLLGAAVGILLLIACVNVANVLLVRSTGRAREFAIRTALGASRARLGHQLLVESTILAVLGGCLGCLLAVWGIDVLGLLLADSLPRAAEIRLDLSVLTFALATSVVAGLLFGLAPAWNASRLASMQTLKRNVGNGRRGVSGRRITDALVVSEVALATTLLVGASLFLHSFWKLSRPATGFEAGSVLTFDLAWPSTRYPDPSEPFTRLRARLLAIPGVLDASTGVQVPDRGPATLDDTSPFVEIEGQSVSREDRQRVSVLRIQPRYFRTMGIPVISGREFGEEDDADGTPVVIVNESLARAYLEGNDALGRELTLDSWALLGESAAQIVGIVSDVHHRGTDGAQPLVYLPMRQRPAWQATMVIRTAGDPLGFVSAVREAVRAVDAGQPIDNIQTLATRISGTIASDRSRALLLATFSGIAVVLAAVGVYGVVAYTTSQQSRDIGIRIALGAKRGTVSWDIVKRGMQRVIIGLMIGIVMALALTRLVQGLLFDVSPTDPVTAAMVVVTMTFVTVLACAVPARRAAWTDPLRVLRDE